MHAHDALVLVNHILAHDDLVLVDHVPVDLLGPGEHAPDDLVLVDDVHTGVGLVHVHVDVSSLYFTSPRSLVLKITTSMSCP